MSAYIYLESTSQLVILLKVIKKVYNSRKINVLCKDMLCLILL